MFVFKKEFAAFRHRMNEYFEHAMSNDSRLNKKINALEDYLDVEYFEGGVQKPHYRKRRIVAKKRGRKPGSKNKVKNDTPAIS